MADRQIKSNKNHCRTARHFNRKCCVPSNKYVYLKVQTIKEVYDNNNNECNIEDILSKREQHCRLNCLLFRMAWIVLWNYRDKKENVIEKIRYLL